MWITFVWNCLPCFSNTKIGSVTSFSILFNFQGPVRLSRPADDLIILSQKWFFVKHFFEAFRTFWTWIASDFSELTGIFQRLLVLFSRFSAGTSEVILLSQRLALKYNTIHRGGCQHFFTSFFKEIWISFIFLYFIFYPISAKCISWAIFRCFSDVIS